MTPARASLLLLLATAPLAIASCGTLKKPLSGFDKLPPGSILLNNLVPNEGGALMLWPLFDLPSEPLQVFRLRLDGQDAVIMTAQQEGFYDYAELSLSGWTGGWGSWFQGVPPGTYAVELVDSAGQSWGRSAPLAVPAGLNAYSGVQLPGAILAHFGGQVASWNIDPAEQDADPATDEITVTNMIGEEVVVERCMIASGSRTSCTSLGTVAPGADLHTVETAAGLAKNDHKALLVRLASDASQAYQRDLVLGSNGSVGESACQIERIIVHGNRSPDRSTLTGPVAIAVSTCYGYQSGPG